jgi:transcriptional regulator with XRE-family HTH domain
MPLPIDKYEAHLYNGHMKQPVPGASTRTGLAIRAERQRRRLSGRNLAGLVGLTPSALSQIERGLVDPSMSTLRRIADSLEMPMFWFVTEHQAGDPDIVVRRADRRVFNEPPGGASFQALTRGLNRRLELLVYTLGPGEMNLTKPAVHRGDECTLILRGEGEVEVAGMNYRLGAGDTIYITGGSPHRIANVGSGDLEALVAVIASVPDAFA